jgi:outer membrane lipoprotein-sorting protein
MNNIFLILILTIFLSACSFNQSKDSVGAFMDEVVKALEGLSANKKHDPKELEKEWEEVDKEQDK